MNKKIMIVDDDPDILVSLRTIFEHQKFEVLAVDSGNDCIEELEKGFKGIILMDLIMPFMDGWDTLRQIIDRGLNEDVLIFIITAIGSPDSEKMKGLESHIYDYIPKPFDLRKLITEVNALTIVKKAKNFE